ncbi:uncharacterized protein LOC119367901 [Triticum dicoccoides]|uniref:uncharacterized protein LOC119367901 n=1 Tax=Triticum dicoccoides TaxID=85692 RepID=UPI00188FD01E|nr:uncharacterized protein LOC119367901 [Triticum dicoccoides]
MDHITKFVATRLPESYNKEKQKKLSIMVHEMCSEISHSVGKLVYNIGRIDDIEAGTSTTEPSKMGTSRQRSKRRSKQLGSDSESLLSEEGNNSLPSQEDSHKSDSDDKDKDGDESDEADDDGEKATAAAMVTQMMMMVMN